MVFLMPRFRNKLILIENHLANNLQAIGDNIHEVVFVPDRSKVFRWSIDPLLVLHKTKNHNGDALEHECDKVYQ